MSGKANEHEWSVRACFSGRGLEEFWNGAAFTRADEGQELAYDLTQVLLRNLMTDYRRPLADFVCNADASDHGQAAAQQFLGVGLADLAAQFLGPGDWAPH